MDRHIFEEFIYKHWTDYFGCPAETARQSGITLLPESKYDGDKVIVIWHIGEHSFVQFDPALSARLDQLKKELPLNTHLSGENILGSWGEESILSMDTGLVYYLFPPSLPDPTPRHPFILRQLTDKDAEAMSALHAANTAEDVDEGFVEVSHLVAFGCFYGDQLVSAASGYMRTGFLDIGILTHPDFRKKGLGKSAVGGVCQWAIQRDIIAQYRHNVLNINSQYVAKSLNFEMYFRSESINLR